MRKGMLWKLVAGGSAVGIGAAAGVAAAGTNATPQPVELGETADTTTLDIEGGPVAVATPSPGGDSLDDGNGGASVDTSGSADTSGTDTPAGMDTSGSADTSGTDTADAVDTSDDGGNSGPGGADDPADSPDDR